MGKQRGPYPLIGTIGGVTFYKMMGRFYVRAKSSIDRKRIKNDAAFAAFRANGKLHGRASRLASQLYKTLPASERKHPNFGRLTAVIKQYMQEGMSEEEIISRWNEAMSTQETSSNSSTNKRRPRKPEAGTSRNDQAA